MPINNIQDRLADTGRAPDPRQWQACLDAVVMQLHTPDLAAAISRSDAAMMSAHSVAARATLRESGIPLAMAEPPSRGPGKLPAAATAATLSDAQLATLRYTLVSDLTPKAIASLEYVHPGTVVQRRIALKNALAIKTPGDWLPILAELRQMGRLSEPEFATAVRKVAAQVDSAAGPLVRQLADSGMLPPDEAAAATRAARLSERGISGLETKVLDHLADGRPLPEIAESLDVTVDYVKILMTALGQHIQVAGIRDYGTDIRCAVLVGARDAGLLLPAALASPGLAVAEIWERARGQGFRLSTLSAEYLHAANGNATLADLRKQFPDLGDNHAGYLAQRFGVTYIPRGAAQIGRRLQIMLDAARKSDLIPTPAFPVNRRRKRTPYRRPKGTPFRRGSPVAVARPEP